MAAAEIQIVNPSNLQKIESFLNDSAYKEAIENSANFNTRLCVERRLRMPFLDLQTGVAQTHCSLFMTKRQRMPGMREGQIYTYPSQRWRKARRQYLTLQTSRWAWPLGAETAIAGPEGLGEDSCGLPGDSGHGEDSRDGSQSAVKDDPKEWFYDELAMEELEGLEEPEPESDEDYYDDTYANRRRRRGGGNTAIGPRGGRQRAGARASASGGGGEESTPSKRGRSGRGRRRAAQGTLPYEVAGDAEKPYGCELCGARYKTRPGLTYHYTHSHKEPAAAGSDGEAPTAPPAAAQPAEYQDSYVTFLNNPTSATASSSASTSSSAAPAPSPAARRPRAPPASSAPASPPAEPPSPARPPSADTSTSDSNVSAAPPAPAAVEVVSMGAGGGVVEENGEKPKRDKASPSPYCDFCLGDNRENKKTGTPEELVSCSDCGRSGHPTCLQFTANMIVSVRKYRWQCIECKCCSVCGNSDNDDQLLFCDDCDRGYHMYCLAPPLAAPPEGSWSCQLCLRQFHGK